MPSHAMNDQPKQHRDRKRQLAGVLLIGLAFYPFSIGGFGYAVGRRWVPKRVVTAGLMFYEPANLALGLVPTEGGQTLSDRWHDWFITCVLRGQKDRERR